MPVVLKTIKGKVGILTLNRPKRLNAWTGPLQTQLYDGLVDFENDPNVNVIIVTGAGRGFCAGADMDTLQNGAQGKPIDTAIREQPDLRTVIFTMSIKKPVIAAINGAAAGIGLAFACACDIRFANRKAKFTLAFPKRGLVAEHATSWTLPRLMGTGNAMMFALSSDIILGDEAYRTGLVQKVFDDNVLEHTLKFAQRLAENVSPTSMYSIKQQIWQHAHLDVTEATRQSIQLMRESLKRGNKDFKEGVESFIEKRKPNFAPLSKKNPVMQLGEHYFSKL